VFVGTDSVHSDELHDFHHGDTYNPIEPATLLTLLGALGFARISITVDQALTFIGQTRT
jgi:hypothetical protein